MSQQQYVLEKTFDAENNLSAKQYYFVELGGSDNQVDVCNASTDLAIGVLQNEPKQYEPANVRILGTTKVIASGSITKGQWVGPDGAGKAETKSTDKHLVRGIALETVTTDGDLLEILLVNFTISV